MKLTRVHLRDFRSFEDATFDLTKPGGEEPLDVVLLVGGNGSGKTAFLQAVAGFFTATVDVTGTVEYGAETLVGRDVRQGATSAVIEIEWQDWFSNHDLSVPIKWAIAIQPNTRPAVDTALYETDWDLFKAFRTWRGSLYRSRCPAGLIVAFDVYRLLPPRKLVSGPNLTEVVRHRCEMALAPTISRDGVLRARSQQLKQWIVNLDFLRAKAKADRGEILPLWDILRHSLNTLLSPYAFEGVDDDFQVIFQTPSGKVPLEALSDGFLSVFVVISELLFRLSLSTTKQEDVLVQEGVCMIDEIDAHLHPRWQENVIPGLRAMFPNVQFIATTHSPIVVSSVEPENVFRLEQEGP